MNRAQRRKAKRIAANRAKRADELNQKITDLPWRKVRAHLDQQLSDLQAKLSWKVGDQWQVKWGDMPPQRFLVTETTQKTMTIRPATLP